MKEKLKTLEITPDFWYADGGELTIPAYDLTFDAGLGYRSQRYPGWLVRAYSSDHTIAKIVKDFYISCDVLLSALLYENCNQLVKMVVDYIENPKRIQNSVREAEREVKDWERQAYAIHAVRDNYGYKALAFKLDTTDKGSRGRAVTIHKAFGNYVNSDGVVTYRHDGEFTVQLVGSDKTLELCPGVVAWQLIKKRPDPEQLSRFNKVTRDEDTDELYLED